MPNIRVQLINNEIDYNAYTKWCHHPSAGAVTVFVGTTRDNFEDKKVTTLSYEAYDELALNEMRNICKEALEKYGGVRACMVHRLGEVKVEEASIICVISTPHRKEGFEACEWMMNELKKRVSIWKKEIFDDGNSVWK